MPVLQYLSANLENEDVLYFSYDVWNQIHQFKQEGLFKKEKGGIFLGKERSDSLEIVEATTPQKGDISSRFNFHRKSKNHQNIALNRWSNSNSTITYLGEWHTHPQKYASPSSHDINEWQNKLSGYFLPLILVIIGIETDWVGVLSPKGNLYEISLQ